jgi:hypothetical protein
MTRSRLSQLGAVVAVAFLGVLVGRASVSAADQAAPRTAAPQRMVPTERNAAVAAIEYLGALRWDVLIDDAERRRVIEGRATPEAADDLEAELVAPSNALREAVSQPPVIARTAVLGYRVLQANDRRASVRIWGMALFGSGAYKPATQWSTSDLALVWSGDRWLVDGVESRGGPSPGSGLKALAARARGLKEVHHAP